MSEVEATTTAVEKDSPDTTVDAVSLLAQGKRNMVCGEIPQAVNQLQEACRLLAAQYGETADECGEVYFLYGKALLDMARLESGVLGNALQGVPDEDTETEEKENTDKPESDKTETEKEEASEEDMDKIREQVFDAMGERDEEVAARDKKENKDEKKEEAAEGSEKKDEKAEEKEEKVDEAEEKEKDSEDKENAEKKDETDEKKEAETETMETENEEAEGEGETEGDTAEEGEEGTEGEGAEEGETSEQAKEEEEDADDVPNLQLAWEMLELAKVIFSRQDSKEMKLKTAETYLKLGEVGLETEQYEQAIGDFNECLKLQKEHLEADDRLLAETYYQLGLACSFNAQFDDAINNYQSATKVIESKLGKLNKFIEENESGKGKAPASDDDPVVRAQKEVKELKEILPDIMTKIEDAEEEKKNKDQVKQMVKENITSDMGTTTSGFGEVSSTTDKAEKSVSNITHLVRKKRKPEEEEETTETKKPRQDEEKAAGDAENGKDEKKDEETKTTTNGAGDANGTAKLNGSAVNGNGVHKSPEKTTEDQPKIVAKTVEDVLKQKEGEDKMDTSDAAEVKTSS